MVREIICDVVCGMGEIGQSLWNFMYNNKINNINPYGIDLRLGDNMIGAYTLLDEFKNEQEARNLKVRILKSLKKVPLLVNIIFLKNFSSYKHRIRQRFLEASIRISAALAVK